MRFRLVEAFSPSMPKIIKDYIMKNPKYSTKKLLERGIDVATANFQHYPQPTSVRDPIFRHDDTKEIFFTFPETHPDMVYLKDENGDDNSFVPDPRGWGWKPWKYISAKDMIANGVDVWFVDKTETGVESRVAKERTKRANYGLAYDPNRRFDLTDVANNNYSSWGRGSKDPSGISRTFSKKVAGGDDWNLDTKKLDKSGYLRNPNKYLDKLRNSPNYRPDKKMVTLIQTLRDDIEALNSRIINGAQTFDSDQIFSSDYHNKPMNNLRNALNNIGNAIDEYNGAVSELADFTKYLDDNQERDMYYVKRYQDRINGKLSSAKSQCDKAKMAMAEWLTTIVDWDTEDYIDDGM